MLVIHLLSLMSSQFGRGYASPIPAKPSQLSGGKRQQNRILEKDSWTYQHQAQARFKLNSQSHIPLNMGSKRKRQAQDTAAAPAAKKQAKESTNDAKIVEAVAIEAEPEAPLPPTEPFVEHPKGPELKREVGYYNQLSSEDANERLIAANAVITGLLSGEGVSEATLVRHLERRLFRGLASGRKGARLGYSIALAEILGQLFGDRESKYPELTFEKVLDILRLKTKPEGDLSGQEEKDHALGLLFGLQSFVRARILFVEDGARWKTVFDSLLHLCHKKSWMREEVGWVIVEALAQMNQAQAEETIEKLIEAKLAVTPEGVGIWLTARRLFPDMKFPSKPWGSSGNPLEHLKTVGKALKDSSSGDDNQAKATGNWNPNLHFVWNIVVENYIAGAKAGIEDVGSEFEKFWKVAVDENLFSASASRERKFWGMLLFQKMLNDTPNYPELMTSICSPNLVRCLINHVSKEDRFLNRAAEKSMRTLQQTAEANPHTIPVILPKLISGSGFYNFDQVTKTKTIDKMLGWVQGKDAEEVVQMLLKPAMIVENCEDAKDAETRRQCFADYLLSMIRRVDMSDEKYDASWVKSTALPTLARLSYSKKHVKCKPELSQKSRDMFRSRLTSAFAHLISDSKGFVYPCELLQSVKTDAVEMEDEITEAKDKALATMEKLLKKSKKSSDKEKVSLEALALLYALVVFQLLNGEADAAMVLDELKICYDKLVKGKEGEEDVSMVLVEILLSLLSRPSLLLRKVAQHVFTAFSGEITAEGLALLTDVLSASESTKGQQELFDQNDDEEEEHDHADGSDDELDSDVEMVELNGAEEEPESSADEKDDDEEEEPEDDENATALDAALAAALGTHRLDQDVAAEESESDADMSDSEMLDLDAKLVEIFKQRKKAPNKKKEKKDARETVVNFKNRILDLLEIYVKKQPGRPEAFGLILPLLDCMKTTGTKQVGEKAHGVLAAFGKAYKSISAKTEDLVAFDIAERIELLKQLHEEAAKDVNGSHAFAKAVSSASLLVASSLWKADKKIVKKIAGVYKDSQIAWVMGEKKFAASLFHDWTNWCQSHSTSA